MGGPAYRQTETFGEHLFGVCVQMAAAATSNVEYFLERDRSAKYPPSTVLYIAACLCRTPLADGSFDARWELG